MLRSRGQHTGTDGGPGGPAVQDGLTRHRRPRASTRTDTVGASLLKPQNVSTEENRHRRGRGSTNGPAPDLSSGGRDEAAARGPRQNWEYCPPASQPRPVTQKANNRQGLYQMNGLPELAGSDCKHSPGRLPAEFR